MIMIDFAIDMPTVLLFLFWGNIITAALLAVYSSDFISNPTNRQFLVAKLLQGIAWFLLALRGKIPDILSAHVGNSILLTGLALEALALITVDKPVKRLTLYFEVIVAVFIIVFFGFAKQSNQYVYISSFFSALIFLSVAFLILQDARKSGLRYTLSIIYTICCSILLVRCVNAFFNSEYKLMSSEVTQNLTFLSTYCLLIISGSSFLLLQRERTDRLLKVAYQELEELARIDSLTGLSNRRRLDDYLTFAIKENRRQKKPLAVIMIDIDFFKNYNDYYGHSSGDRCLVQVAAKIKQTCQPNTDMVARYGGEEFVVILTNSDPAGAGLIAEAVRQGVCDLAIPHAASEVSDHVTLSIGVFSAVPVLDQHDYDWYLTASDRRLYNAKRAGRNRCICE
jgi:diguanylate cyclase (GGDEF)-like protein